MVSNIKRKKRKGGEMRHNKQQQQQQEDNNNKNKNNNNKKRKYQEEHPTNMNGVERAHCSRRTREGSSTVRPICWKQQLKRRRHQVAVEVPSKRVKDAHVVSVEVLEEARGKNSANNTDDDEATDVDEEAMTDSPERRLRDRKHDMSVILEEGDAPKRDAKSIFRRIAKTLRRARKDKVVGRHDGCGSFLVETPDVDRQRDDESYQRDSVAPTDDSNESELDDDHPMQESQETLVNADDSIFDKEDNQPIVNFNCMETLKLPKEETMAILGTFLRKKKRGDELQVLENIVSTLAMLKGVKDPVIHKKQPSNDANVNKVESKRLLKSVKQGLRRIKDANRKQLPNILSAKKSETRKMPTVDVVVKNMSYAKTALDRLKQELEGGKFYARQNSSYKSAMKKLNAVLDKHNWPREE